VKLAGYLLLLLHFLHPCGLYIEAEFMILLMVHSMLSYRGEGGSDDSTTGKGSDSIDDIDDVIGRAGGGRTSTGSSEKAITLTAS
jgi:hypothetical protein